MAPKFNQITWYSRFLTLVFVFGVFPVLVFTIGKKYQQTVDVLNNANSMAYDLHTSGQYKKDAYSGVGALNFSQTLSSDWVSEQDSDYTVRFKEDNTFYDVYDGDIVSSGVWQLKDSLPESRFASLPQALYLEKKAVNKNGVAELLYYKIEYIAPDGLTLKYLEKGNIISFKKKVTSTSATSSAIVKEGTSTVPVAAKKPQQPANISASVADSMPDIEIITE